MLILRDLKLPKVRFHFLANATKDIARTRFFRIIRKRRLNTYSEFYRLLRTNNQSKDNKLTAKHSTSIVSSTRYRTLGTLALITVALVASLIAINAHAIVPSIPKVINNASTKNSVIDSNLESGSGDVNEINIDKPSDRFTLFTSSSRQTNAVSMQDRLNQPSDNAVLTHQSVQNYIDNNDKPLPSLAKVMQAEFMISRGNIDEGLRLYKHEALKQNATPVFERALELSLLYEPVDTSLLFASVWQRQNPEHVPAQFYVAHLALQAYNYQLAGEVISKILANDPQADLSELLMGIYPDNEEDSRTLLATIETLPEHNNPALLVLQAGLRSQLGQPEAAYESVSRALKAQPNNIPFITLKADIIDQLQPSSEVLSYIRQQRKRLPKSKALYLYEIRYLIAQNRPREAWELLIDTNKRFDDPEITLLAALVSIDIEAYETADDLLADLAAEPQYVDQAYFYLGISAERQHNYETAERYLSKVTQDDLILQAKQKQVAIYLLLDQPEQALNTLKKFSQQYDVYIPDSAVMQADILRRQNKLAEAKRLLAAVNEQFPDDPKLLFARARLLDSQQDSVLKRQLLDHLIFLDPQNPDYRLALAIVLFETGDKENTAESLQIAQDILDIPYGAPTFKQDNYIQATNILAADALSQAQYQQVIDYLETIYDVTPTLDSGILLLRAYQGLKQDDKVAALFADIQDNFAVPDKTLNDHLQSY